MMMNKKNLITVALLGLLGVGVITANLFAQNRQEYKMDNAAAEHYINLSREQIDNDNLPLAQVYAKKAVQSNSWSQKSWANYNDIVQRLADEGEIKDFNTFIEEANEAAAAATAGGGESKFEGC
jgi:hypothetical protein